MSKALVIKSLIFLIVGAVCLTNCSDGNDPLEGGSSYGSEVGTVNCIMSSGCIPISFEICVQIGTPVPVCPAVSSSSTEYSSSSLQSGDVWCIIGPNCLALSLSTCNSITGTPVLSCPADAESSSSANIGLPSSSSMSTGLSSSSGISTGLPSSSSTTVIQPASGPVSVYGKLKASGNKIVGSRTGTAAVQVRGVSLGWSNTGWGSEYFFNAATINAMVDSWKAEIIRVPIGYVEDGGYKTDASNKTRVKAAIDAAINKGVYVIIDWHSHDANNELAAATSYFTEMARDYGSYDNVIFEIFNEPKSISWSTIKTYATSIIGTIRTYSDNLVLVGTPNWDQDVDAPIGDFLSDGNVAYVAHFYANSHALSDYTAGGWNSGTTFQSAIEAVLSAGKPVFVSEYGTVSADGNGTHNATATNAWMTFLNGKNISYCAWHVTNVNEASAYFIPTFTPSATAGWTTTSNMNASGQYIYNNLVSWANSAPWRSGNIPTGSSSSGSGTTSALYCDFGYPTTGDENGCYPIEYASECDTEYGRVATSCGRTDLRYCDWGERYYDSFLGEYQGGCYRLNSAYDEYDCEYDYGYVVTRCPTGSL